MVEQPKSVPETIKKPKFSQILNIPAAALALLFFGSLGPVKKVSAEFNETQKEIVEQLPKRGESENPSDYLARVRVDFTILFKEHPSLKKTTELYSEEEIRNLLNSLEKFVNANFYIGYPDIRQEGDMNVYPDRSILVEGIKELIVENLGGKLVSTEKDAEFVIQEITISGKRFSDKRFKIVRDFLELRTVEPSVTIKISIIDEREKLKPKKVVLKGYARIRGENLEQKGRGDFTQNELNKAAKEAIGNIDFFIQTLYRQKEFIEATKHLRNPIFLIEEALLIDSKTKEDKEVFYIVSLDKKLGQYFQIGDKVRIVDSNGETVEEFKITKCFYYINEKTITFFIKSSNLEPNNKDLEKIKQGQKRPLYIEKVNPKE